MSAMSGWRVAPGRCMLAPMTAAPLEATPSRPRLLYLHGFASGTGSTKAVRFAQDLAARGVSLEVLDLEAGDFAGLTISRQLALLDRVTAGAPEASVLLLGSSLGGYVAALQAARSPAVAGLVLMAPALDFHRRWCARLGAAVVAEWRRRGFMLVMHHGRGELESIRASLIEDAALHPPFPEPRVPTLILHGAADEVVDASGSEEWAAAHPDLIALELLPDADHSLAAVVPYLLERSRAFLARWVPELR